MTDRPGSEFAGGDASGRDWMEILLHFTVRGELVVHIDGSGMASVTRHFRSGTDLGDFVATRLAPDSPIDDPILQALRQAASRLPGRS